MQQQWRSGFQSTLRPVTFIHHQHKDTDYWRAMTQRNLWKGSRTRKEQKKKTWSAWKSWTSGKHFICREENAEFEQWVIDIIHFLSPRRDCPVFFFLSFGCGSSPLCLFPVYREWKPTNQHTAFQRRWSCCSYSLGNLIIHTGGFQVTASEEKLHWLQFKSIKVEFPQKWFGPTSPGTPWCGRKWFVDGPKSLTDKRLVHICIAFALETLNSYHPSLIFFFFWQSTQPLMRDHSWRHEGQRTWLM